MSNRQTRFHALFAPTLESLGLELWGMDFQSHGKRSLLRIYIENPNGVTVDDCAKASRQLSALLDVEDPIGGEYTFDFKLIIHVPLGTNSTIITWRSHH